MRPQFVIGIDLGTTNSALAYIEPAQAPDADFPPIHVLDIPQQVAEGVIETRRVLPSFLYLGPRRVVGVWAREQGALTPARVVSSAKSWLSNPEVDRTARILPWEARPEERSVSPVEASAEFLGHLKRAWEESGRGLTSEHRVVLTVPASFDEEARELTVAAAEQAGLGRIELLEEPSAAFYAWVARHPAEARKQLFDGQLVLVCDVGGGTTDFTLIRVSRAGDRLEFTRIAVGKHLLLGGDNLDLTLAWLAETKLGTTLSLRQRAALRRQCATAKERLLAEPATPRVEVTVLGAGSSLIGGTLKTEILREEAIELTYEGFLPFCRLTDRPQEESQSPFRELGLPYVADPAITRHLAAFLTAAGLGAGHGPDAILFNGGFFNPALCRQRLADVVASWYGRRPAVLESENLDLAVAVGAAYYGYVRLTGSGLLVRGGLPRTYYIGAGAPELAGERVQAVCLVPRGTETGELLALDRDDLQLVTNRPVAFRLYSSLTRQGEAHGQVVEFTPEELESEIHRHAPLHAVMRFGKEPGDRLVPVRLMARLTEVGTLDIWCESKVSEHRWRLQFELRKPTEAARPVRAASTVINEAALEEAARLVRSAFEAQREPPLAPEELPARLEQLLALGRPSWPLEAIRRLADVLLETAEGRKRNAAWEARWLNLCGFCLRPGFGHPADEWRIEKTRRIWAAGLQFPGRVQNEIEWWIFWGRLAGGLNRNQQSDLFHRISAILLPRGKPPRLNASLLREIWRTAASLELLPVLTKISLGEALLKRIQAGEYTESDLWCLSRLGARDLFYGPANQVLPAATVSGWVRQLLSVPGAAEALALMARQTGDQSRDLPAHVLAQVRRRLEGDRDAGRLLPIFEGEREPDAGSLSRIFGEELPSGLVIGPAR